LFLSNALNAQLHFSQNHRNSMLRAKLYIQAERFLILFIVIVIASQTINSSRVNSTILHSAQACCTPRGSYALRVGLVHSEWALCTPRGSYALRVGLVYSEWALCTLSGIVALWLSLLHCEPVYWQSTALRVDLLSYEWTSWRRMPWTSSAVAIPITISPQKYEQLISIRNINSIQTKINPRFALSYAS
jgi:hypothetical protein